jgi:hypothetical protein
VEKDSNIIMKELSEFLTESVKTITVKNIDTPVVVVYDYTKDNMTIIKDGGNDDVMKSIINIIGKEYAEMLDETFLVQPTLYTTDLDQYEMVNTTVYPIYKNGKEVYRIVSLWGSVHYTPKFWKK